MVTTDEYRAQLAAIGLDRFADALIERSLPSIRLRPAPSGRADLLIGSTKLGGEPDLPRDFVWPTFQGVSHAFIAQINLHDIAPLDKHNVLPEAGLLSFFYIDDISTFGLNLNDRGGWHVAYFPLEVTLTRRAFPADLDQYSTFPPVSLSPTRELTFLPGNSYILERLGLNEDERWGYERLMGNFFSQLGITHQLLGHPWPIQGDMQRECQLVTQGIDIGKPESWKDPRIPLLSMAADDWCLLLQVDSDYTANMMWGDAGCIYYWIRRSDLTERRFDQCWFHLQCS